VLTGINIIRWNAASVSYAIVKVSKFKEEEKDGKEE
jgi:hypothetical protein